MADEVTLTTYNDVYPASVLADRILDEERPYNAFTREMFRYVGPEQAMSTIADFPIQSDPGSTVSTTEGTGLTANVALTTSKASATLTTKGLRSTITDEVVDTSKYDIPSQVAAVLGRSCAEKFQVDAATLAAAFANTTGTAGVATTAATLSEAANQLEQRDQVGVAVGVLDPSQIGNVRLDFATSGAAALANSSITVKGLLMTSLNAFAFEWAGVPWLQTSSVTTTGGGVFITDVAMGMFEQWPLRVETERDASMPGTEYDAFVRYGVIEVWDRAGETILI